jgi:hypothetical protein
VAIILGFCFLKLILLTKVFSTKRGAFIYRGRGVGRGGFRGGENGGPPMRGRGGFFRGPPRGMGMGMSRGMGGPPRGSGAPRGREPYQPPQHSQPPNGQPPTQSSSTSSVPPSSSTPAAIQSIQSIETTPSTVPPSAPNVNNTTVQTTTTNGTSASTPPISRGGGMIRGRGLLSRGTRGGGGGYQGSRGGYIPDYNSSGRPPMAGISPNYRGSTPRPRGGFIPPPTSYRPSFDTRQPSNTTTVTPSPIKRGGSMSGPGGPPKRGRYDQGPPPTRPSYHSQHHGGPPMQSAPISHYNQSQPPAPPR